MMSEILQAMIFVVLIIVVLLGLLYNSLVKRKNFVKAAFSNIDVYLKKRCDQIPNLLKAIKSYNKHEMDVFTNVTKLRNEMMNDNIGNSEKIEMSNKLEGEINNLMMVVEDYPEIKADGQYQLYMRSQNEIEEQLAAVRRTYNMAVTLYNNKVNMFPTNIFAAMFNFKEEKLIVVEENVRKSIDANDYL